MSPPSFFLVIISISHYLSTGWAKTSKLPVPAAIGINHKWLGGQPGKGSLCSACPFVKSLDDRTIEEQWPAAALRVPSEDILPSETLMVVNDAAGATDERVPLHLSMSRAIDICEPVVKRSPPE